MKKLAIVITGWHFPLHLYKMMATQVLPDTWSVTRFVVTHRDPELPVVWEEKHQVLKGLRYRMDLELYRLPASRQQLRNLGYIIYDAPNSIGDWGFLNQWLRECCWHQYDVILYLHDDTLILRNDLLFDVLNQIASLYGRDGITESPISDWAILSSGYYPEAPPAYLRGSFEFFKRETIEALGGSIPMGEVKLTRIGESASPPYEQGLAPLDPWNANSAPVRDRLIELGLGPRVLYLSPHYRVSPYMVEGERGFIHRSDFAPESFQAGINWLSSQL
jgi:hypothetical protein